MKDLQVETATAVKIGSNSITGSLKNLESTQNEFDCAIFITYSFKLAAILKCKKDLFLTSIC